MKKTIVFLLLAAFACGLASCTLLPPALTLEGNEYTCLLYGESRLYQITVKSEDRVVARIKVNGVDVGADDCNFEFIDMNFDGHEDIRFATSEDREGTRYRCWIWDPSLKSFSVDKNLNRLLSPDFDAATETLKASYYIRTVEPAVGDEPETFTAERGVVTYGWRQRALVALRRECATYYGESDFYCVAIWEINESGELEATSERWFNPEQYESAGYFPIT